MFYMLYEWVDRATQYSLEGLKSNKYKMCV